MPAQDLPLDGNHVFVGTDGCGVEVIDLESGERRRSGLQDVVDIARVADYTEEVGFHWVALSAQDSPPETRGLHELKAIWENSTKHVQTESIYSEDGGARRGRDGSADRRRTRGAARSARCSRSCSAPLRRWARTAAAWMRL